MIYVQDDSLSDAQRLDGYRAIINRFLYGAVPDAAAAYRPDGAEINAAARVIGQMLGRLSHMPEAQALGLAYAVHMVEFLPEHPLAAQLVLRRLMLDRAMLPHACDLAKNLVEPLGRRANRAPLIRLVERALVETTVIGAHQDKAIELARVAAHRINRWNVTLGCRQDLGAIVMKVLKHTAEQDARDFLDDIASHWTVQGFSFDDQLADLVERVLSGNHDKEYIVPWAAGCFRHAMELPCRQSARRMAIAMMQHPNGREVGYQAAHELFKTLEQGGPIGWSVSLAHEMLQAEQGSDRAIAFARAVESLGNTAHGDQRESLDLLKRAIDTSHGSERAAGWLIDMFRAADDNRRNNLHPVFTALAQTSGTGDIRFAALATYINHLTRGDVAVYSNRLGHLLTAITDRTRDETLFDFGILGLKYMARHSLLAGDFNAAADAVFDVHRLMTPRTGRMAVMAHSLRAYDGTVHEFARTLGGARNGTSLWPFLAVFPPPAQQGQDETGKDHTDAACVIALNGAIMSPPDALRHIAQADDFPPRFKHLAGTILAPFL